MKINIYTLGCKVNQCESQALCDLLSSRGDTAVTDGSGDAPDVCIVNTCAVTGESEMKSRKLFSKIKREFPNAVTVLCGCMPQVAADPSVFGADIVVGSKNRSNIPGLIDSFLREHRPQNGVRGFCVSESFEEISPGGAGESRTRGFLKIEDGCDRMCAYCIIPRARGPVRSMPLESITENSAALTAAGHDEIVLTGINLAAYGQEFGLTLGDAVTACAKAGPKRIRLGSVEADLLDDRFIDTLLSCPQFCPQFHLSLQSGSDAVLKRMGRRYDCAQYYALTQKIRRLFSDPGLTTDIMVGFPGETDAEFRESVEFVKKVGFLRLHVFTYSVRPGTAAAQMPQVSDAVKKKRAAEMEAVGRELAEKAAKNEIGATLSVLFESADADGVYTGWSKNYLPVRAKCREDLRGRITDVKITENEGPVCIGVPVII